MAIESHPLLTSRRSFSHLLFTFEGRTLFGHKSISRSQDILMSSFISLKLMTSFLTRTFFSFAHQDNLC